MVSYENKSLALRGLPLKFQKPLKVIINLIHYIYLTINKYVYYYIKLYILVHLSHTWFWKWSPEKTKVLHWGLFLKFATNYLGNVWQSDLRGASFSNPCKSCFLAFRIRLKFNPSILSYSLRIHQINENSEFTDSMEKCIF